MTRTIKNKRHKKQFDELVDMIWQRESDFTRWINEVELFHNNFTGEIHSWNDLPNYVAAKNLGYSIDQTTLLIPAHFHKAKAKFIVQLINYLRSKVLTIYGDSVRITRWGESAIGFMKDISDEESAIFWISFFKLEGNLITVEFKYGVFSSMPTAYPNSYKTKDEIAIDQSKVLKPDYIMLLVLLMPPVATVAFFAFILISGSILIILNVLLSPLLSIFIKSPVILAYTVIFIWILTSICILKKFLCSHISKRILKRYNCLEICYSFLPSIYSLTSKTNYVEDNEITELTIADQMRDRIIANKHHQIFRDTIIGIFQEVKSWVESNRQ